MMKVTRLLNDSTSNYGIVEALCSIRIMLRCTAQRHKKVQPMDGTSFHRSETRCFSNSLGWNV